MSRDKYNKDIYLMYEKEVEKNKKLTLKYNELRLEVENLRYENKKLNDKLFNIDFTKKKEFDFLKEKLVKLFNEEILNLNSSLLNAYDEINRLKKNINDKNNENKKEIDKDYLIDSLNNRVNKDSTNSSIPTSKEISNSNKKTRTNSYNNRKPSNKKSGGQIGSKGKTLTKDKIKEIIETKNVEVREIKHYINGNSSDVDILKYRVGIETKVYIEKHIFIKTPDATEKLPKEFHSDVTYKEDIKILVVALGNYFSIPYNKIKELLYDLTDGIIDISEGTIDNIYEEFSIKTEPTLSNITNNILNGTYQHTDETVTKENGKDTYYRGYANKENVIYMYHKRKGDKPIEEDGILTNFYGTIISDHDVGIFKYGLNNQDCIIHFGRYCIEKEQNVKDIFWPMDLYRLLLKFEMNREILLKFGCKQFSEYEIEQMEKEYDEILTRAKLENENISSIYWKEKCNTLLNRSIKYKKQTLLYIHDFSIPYDNNFMERALRMIKGKTKVSGGFRSNKGAIRFGKTMSIIKTAKLRDLNPFKCIKAIFNGNELFA